MHRIRKMLESALWLILAAMCYLIPLGIHRLARYDGQLQELRKLERTVERERIRRLEMEAVERQLDAFNEEVGKLAVELESLHQVPRLEPDPPFDGHIEELMAWGREHAISIRPLGDLEGLSSGVYDSKRLEFTAAGDRQTMTDSLRDIESHFPQVRVVYIDLHHNRPTESFARVVVEVFLRSSL